ncbi:MULTISPECIES: hypothetical protein [unclassified Paraburkholderia]|uniref:hypothetical protein n=1 Tax=unclassified Paraburkholderia TaxID=2615204 RepID=UPI002AB0542B|nr:MULTISPECIES: hypothetical protein [unclassified Paraburkholderia]
MQSSCAGVAGAAVADVTLERAVEARMMIEGSLTDAQKYANIFDEEIANFD